MARAGVVLLLLLPAALADDPVPALLARLDAKEVAERVAAARALGRIDDERARAAVLRAQSDASAEVRHEAAVALARAGKADATTVEILAASLGSGDWYVRWQACVALRQIGSAAEPALPDLVKALEDGTADVSREAALALVAVAPKDPRTLAALIAALGIEKGDHAAICHAIGTLGPAAADAIPALVREIEGPDEALREKAFAALRRVAPGVVLVYDSLLKSADPGVRRCGVRGLGGLRSKEVLESLAFALSDRAPGVRAAVVEAATNLRQAARPLLPKLMPLLADEDEQIRRQARAAIESAGGRELAQLVWRTTVRRTLGFGQSDVVEVTQLWLPFEDNEWSRLYKALTEPDVGPGVLNALLTIHFDDQQSLLESILSDKAHARRRPCAALLLPYIASDLESAAKALKAAAQEDELKDVAERALAVLEARK